MPEYPILIHTLVDVRSTDPKGILTRIENKLDRLLASLDVVEKHVNALERRIKHLEANTGRG